MRADKKKVSIDLVPKLTCMKTGCEEKAQVGFTMTSKEKLFHIQLCLKHGQEAYDTSELFYFPDKYKNLFMLRFLKSRGIKLKSKDEEAI